MLRSCAVVVWMTCLLATAWGRYLNEDDYGMIPMQDIETETQPIENSGAGSQQVQQMGYAYGNQQQTTTSSELPPTSSELPSTSAPTQMLDIPMLSDNNYNQYSGYGSGYDEGYNSGSSGEEYNSGASGEESGSGLIGFDPVPGNEGSGEGSGSFSPSDCPHLSNGNYPLSACSTQFLACSNGLPFIMDCPEQLVYNWDVDQCDWPHNRNCTDEGDNSGEGSGDFHGPSDCPTLADGNYAMSACDHQFLTCSNGLPHVMDCPANLVYNAESDMCDWPHNLNCTDEGDNSGEGSGDFHGPSDCPNLADGNYAMSACGHQFLTCSNGLPHVMDCPAELVYNPQHDMCDWPSNMGCEDQESGSGSGEGSGDFHGPSDCPNLADGNYAMSACGRQFLTCSNGNPFIFDCPANLVYNAEFDMCDWPHNMDCEGETASDQPVPEESGSGAASGEESGEYSGEESSGEESGLTPTEPMILPLPPVEQPATTTLPATTSTAQIIQEESTTESSGLELLPSTYTAEPETSGVDETTSLTEGSSTEAGAELSGEEGSAEMLGESQSTTTTTTTAIPSTSTLPAVTEVETEEQVQMTTAMPTGTSTQSGSTTTISAVVRHGQLDGSLPSQSTDCSARADGNYQLTRCSGRFLSCSNGIGHLMNCPEQLVFNAPINACDFPSALMCDENSADTGAGSDTLCSSDGVFATESCSPNFHHCINGKLLDLSCDPGQLFSWARELCLPAAEFPECDLH